MKLPRKAINEFKEIYKKQHNVEISDAEANRLGNKLLNLYKLVYLPTNQNEYANEINNTSTRTAY